MQKIRIDLLMVQKNLVESRAKAQALVMAAQVRADGQLVAKPSDKVISSALITIDEGAAFASLPFELFFSQEKSTYGSRIP